MQAISSFSGSIKVCAKVLFSSRFCLISTKLRSVYLNELSYSALEFIPYIGVNGYNTKSK
jgi:hypothetical protein